MRENIAPRGCQFKIVQKQEKDEGEKHRQNYQVDLKYFQLESFIIILKETRNTRSLLCSPRRLTHTSKPHLHACTLWSASLLLFLVASRYFWATFPVSTSQLLWSWSHKPDPQTVQVTPSLDFSWKSSKKEACIHDLDPAFSTVTGTTPCTYWIQAGVGPFHIQSVTYFFSPHKNASSVKLALGISQALYVVMCHNFYQGEIWNRCHQNW